MYSVLVTDDEPTAVKHIESIIEKKCPDFYVAGRARNGKEALEKTLDIHPDILITDIRMPVMDGIQLSEALYSSGEDTKIIIVSGYSEFGYAQSAIKLGVRDYILKPVVPSELQALLFKLKEELKDKYYQGRKEIIRKLSLGQAPKEGEMEKYFPYALYYAALVRRNGLPPRFPDRGMWKYFQIPMKQYLYTEEMNAKPCISVPRNWWTGMILSGSLNIRWKRNSRRPHILPRCTEMSRYPAAGCRSL